MLKTLKVPSAVFIPVCIAVLVAVIGGASFLMWSAWHADEESVVDQHLTVAQRIAREKATFEDGQNAFVARFETVEAFIGGQLATNWIGSELGKTEYEQYGHQRVYVLDPNLKPVFAARDGQVEDASTYYSDFSAIDALAVRLRSPEAIAEIDGFQTEKVRHAPQAADIVNLDGRIAMASVMPIVSDFAGQEQAPGTYYYHVAISYLDGAVASNATGGPAQIDSSLAASADETLIPVANEAGRFVAYVKWVPAQPGQSALSEWTAIGAGLLGTLCLTIGIIFLALLRGSSKAAPAKPAEPKPALARAVRRATQATA